MATPIALSIAVNLGGTLKTDMMVIDLDKVKGEPKGAENIGLCILTMIRRTAEAFNTEADKAPEGTTLQ